MGTGTEVEKATSANGSRQLWIETVVKLVAVRQFRQFNHPRVIREASTRDLSERFAILEEVVYDGDVREP